MNITHKEIILELEENFKKLVETFKINDNNEKDIILKNIELLKGNVNKKNDISTYSDAVKHMALTNMDNEFVYKGLDHALTVFKRFFQHSRSKINIFHDNLNNEIFNDEEFLFYLELHLKSKPLNLVIRKMKRNDSKALELILKYSQINKDVTVNYASNKFIDEVKNLFQSGQKYNFIVSGTAFIMETDPSNLKGLCNFKDKEISKKLNKLF